LLYFKSLTLLENYVHLTTNIFHLKVVMKKEPKCTRSYKLKIEANFNKLEEVRYNARNHSLYLQHFVTQLYFSDKKHLSTFGMGTLANQAQKTAMGILAAHRAATKETGNKSNIPQIKFLSAPAKIFKSKNTKFDYWIKLSSQWKNIPIEIPAKSQSSLNKALKNNWELSERCELVQEKNGSWYCKVYVTRKKPNVVIQKETIGIDVGLKHSVSRSDNYLGKNLRPIIKKQKQQHASRQKQKIKNKASKLSQAKTAVKQFLDREVNLIIRRSLKLGYNISIEDPKVLANLSTGRLQGWARCYFANRLQIRATEEQLKRVFS